MSVEEGYEKLEGDLNLEEKMINERVCGVYGDDVVLRDACHASDIGEAYAEAQTAIIMARAAYNVAVGALKKLEHTLDEAPELPSRRLYTAKDRRLAILPREGWEGPDAQTGLLFTDVLMRMSRRDANRAVNAAKAAVRCEHCEFQELTSRA